ncbi:OsmC family protein [Streptomyces sp. NPDC051020]|uniref:OsmC family protein n=1 Tax=Streptomyces sp. NPDC051020 TaxID=3155409 RepID=UPI00344A9D83
MIAASKACLLGALRRAATARKIRLTSTTTITAEVALSHGDDGEFSLSAVLSPVLGGVDRATVEELARVAHQTCPYSKPLRGNIPVIWRRCRGGLRTRGRDLCERHRQVTDAAQVTRARH